MCLSSKDNEKNDEQTKPDNKTTNDDSMLLSWNWLKISFKNKHVKYIFVHAMLTRCKGQSMTFDSNDISWKWASREKGPDFYKKMNCSSAVNYGIKVFKAEFV